MSDSVNLQTAIFALLGGSSGAVVDGLTVPVPILDNASGASYPYIQIGPIGITPDNRSGFDYFIADFEIMIYDRLGSGGGSGFDRSHRIRDHIYDLLEKGNIMPPGISKPLLNVEGAAQDRSPARENSAIIEMVTTISLSARYAKERRP